MKRLALLLFGLCLLLWCSRSEAHTRSVSYSTWRIDGHAATVTARVSLLDASLIAGAGLTAHVREGLLLSTPAGACRATEPRQRQSDPEWIELVWSVSCPGEGALTLGSSLFVAQNPSHLHLARVSFGDAPPSEHVLDARGQSATLERSAPAPESFSRFVWLGVEHIATGWDHLLFVLMLLFAARSLRGAALVVTGFTLGHSATLTLTVLGALAPREGPVEALIAASIALLAVENVWIGEGRERALLPVAAVLTLVLSALAALALSRSVAPALFGVALFAACYFTLVGRSERPELGRAAVAALFGLVHGFGFARVLTSMELSPVRLARALVGFNLGVELGQLAVIALAFPLLLAVRRRAPERPLGRVAASAALVLACYWFVVRAFDA
ncbi:MAG: HupE/UreJ family protein [Polyangiaceae bacterium]|nr:HupE/UreJ family protein [Polyangiaceae bacterium]MCL4749993.1 HupE/UreJ family protein [Myxococcales bacterium]